MDCWGLSTKNTSQELSIGTFSRPPATSAKIIIGREKYLDTGSSLNYPDDDYFLGYDQIKDAFRGLTNDDVLHPYISDQEFRSSNHDTDVGYRLNVSDIRLWKNFTAAQTIKV